MASLTLKDIPAAVHRALKQRAKQSGRSLNREALAILKASVTPQEVSVSDLLATIRQHRQALPGRLCDSLLTEAKTTGRP